MISPATITAAVTAARKLRALAEQLGQDHSEVKTETDDLKKVIDGADALARLIAKTIK